MKIQNIFLILIKYMKHKLIYFKIIVNIKYIKFQIYKTILISYLRYIYIIYIITYYKNLNKIKTISEKIIINITNITFL